MYSTYIIQILTYRRLCVWSRLLSHGWVTVSWVWTLVPYIWYDVTAMLNWYKMPSIHFSPSYMHLYEILLQKWIPSFWIKVTLLRSVFLIFDHQTSHPWGEVNIKFRFKLFQRCSVCNNRKTRDHVFYGLDVLRCRTLHARWSLCGWNHFFVMEVFWHKRDYSVY